MFLFERSDKGLINEPPERTNASSSYKKAHYIFTSFQEKRVTQQHQKLNAESVTQSYGKRLTVSNKAPHTVQQNASHSLAKVG